MDENRKLDANSALMELDKGLRSPKVGQQCKAIVCFPDLFERFPFPILINSAFLKLGDVFRMGNNFLRLCILRVTQQSAIHLDKIFTQEKLKDRIYSVVHSNDPYARAITLRMLGSLACLLNEDKSVHHSVLQGLDSNDQVEQEAAIFATVQFASHSKEFAKGICNKIAAMLEGLSTPLEIKLKLVPVLQHMHYDIQIFTKARSVLKELLPTYPAQDFVLVTLHTLTNLSMHSVVDVPAQVSLLLQYIRCDPREAVKSLALQDLNTLAQTTPHLWTIEDSQNLCKAYSMPAMQNSVKGFILSILCTLSSTSIVLQLDLNEGSDLITLCRQCSSDTDLQQSVLGTRLMCLLMTHVIKADVGSESYQKLLQKESADALDNLLLVLISAKKSDTQEETLLEALLPSVAETCSVCGPDICNMLVSSIVSSLTVDCDPYDKVSCMLGQVLADILMKCGEKIELSLIAAHLFQMLTEVLSMPCDNGDLQKLNVLLCTILLLINVHLRDNKLGESLYTLITDPGSNITKWSWYRVARQASRFGEHKLASDIFGKLSEDVATERFYFWLNALQKFNEAENCLLNAFKQPMKHCQFSKNIVIATQHYQFGMTSLKCSVSPDHPLHFQCGLAQLRCNMLLAHYNLFQTCNRICTVPPPAVANDADGCEKSAELCKCLKDCKNEFVSLSDKLGDLHLVSFDADSVSLGNVDINNAELASLRRNGSTDEAFEGDGSDHFVKALKKSFTKIFAIAEKLSRADEPLQPLSQTHTDCLLECSKEILKIHFSFPRYFFQSLQTTTIKLAISPSMRSPNDPVTVNANQRLVLKVEGVIRHDGSAEFKKSAHPMSKSKKEVVFRRVAKVKIRVTSTSLQQTPYIKGVDNQDVKMVNTVQPHNDYFSTQFLIHFPVLGNHNVTIESSVIDGSDMCWKFGPKETLLVRSFDDAPKPHKPVQSSSSSSHAHPRPH